MGEVRKGDEVVYRGHLTLVKRPYLGKDFDVVVSKDATIMLYIDEEDNTYLTKQYRPAMEEEVVALPAETLDKEGLSPLEVMVEGLEEECGIRINPSQVKYIGKIDSTDGHDTEKVHLFIAYGEGNHVSQRLEDSEKIEVVKMSFEELYQKVMKNEIFGAKTSYLVMYEKLRRLEENGKN
ncbi:MAG: NUDIX hydrolase [Nanoarchaeota archaeon]|nr:NUDIX hydrolase [Nanoarchaeota archaeon]